MRNLVIWLFIIITIAMLFDSQGNKNTFFKAKVQGDGSVEFVRARDGHFYIQAEINNRNIIFLLDTGATDVVLSHRDAIYTGIDLHSTRNFKTYETAKGFIEAKIIEIPEIKIGNFLISNVEASVNTYSMSRSLLGMSFLKHFDFIIKDDKLILYRS